MGQLRNSLWKLIEVLSLKVKDDSIKENASAAENVGLEVRVTRIYDGIGVHDRKDQCQWCLIRCGKDMTLQEAYAKKAFERHPGCGCEISYTNKKGITRTQSWAGGRESWIEEDLENRKSYGIDFHEGPARHEMVKRMIAGQINPKNQGIVARKVLTKEYSMKQKHQKYLQHLKGSPQYNNATKGRGRPQSFLIISEKEAQDIIYNCTGKGIIDFDRNGNMRDMEFITLDKYIGEYYEKGGWHKTRRIQIMHSKYGAHIVPVKEK